MTCSEFDRWLDDGRPEPAAGPARTHVLSCARCARALEAEQAIESVLLAPTPAAPASLTDAVMARVRAEARPRHAAASTASSPFAWWVRAAYEPTAALALLTAGLLVWRADLLRTLGSAAVVRVGEWLGSGLAALESAAARSGGPAVPAVFTRVEVQHALLLGLMPLALLAMWPLYRWSAHLASLPALRHRAP